MGSKCIGSIKILKGCGYPGFFNEWNTSQPPPAFFGTRMSHDVVILIGMLG